MAQLTQMDASGALVWALDTFEKPPTKRVGGRGSSIPFDFDDLCIFKLAKNTSVRVDFYAIVVQNNDQPMTNSVFALRAPFVTSTASTSTNFNLAQPRDQ